MKKLYKGIHKFTESYYKKKKNLFKKLEKGQSPTVLFITCADSRIDPNLVTNSKPGELFILRNVGNIIPPFESLSDKNSIAAAIEFAIISLKIRDIIVCGHSNCGAMKAIFEDYNFFKEMPHLKNWLQFALPLRDMINNNEKNEFQKKVEQQNIILQLNNLITYPMVLNLFEKGELRLYGWYYEIGTGKIYELDRDSGSFRLIEIS